VVRHSRFCRGMFLPRSRGPPAKPEAPVRAFYLNYNSYSFVLHFPSSGKKPRNDKFPKPAGTHCARGRSLLATARLHPPKRLTPSRSLMKSSKVPRNARNHIRSRGAPPPPEPPPSFCSSTGRTARILRAISGF